MSKITVRYDAYKALCNDMNSFMISLIEETKMPILPHILIFMLLT